MSGPLLYPKAVWRPVPSHGGPMTEQRGLVEHVTTNDFSPYGFFSNPANQASSTWWISPDGTCEQYLDARNRAWAEASGNGTWCSVEMAGKEGTLKTPAQCETLADLLAWGHLEPELGWLLTPSDSPDVHGVGWHGMGGSAWGGHVYCPGHQRVDQTRHTVIPRARQIAGLDQTPQEDTVSPQDIEAVAQRVFQLLSPFVATHQDVKTLLRGDDAHPASITSIARKLGVEGVQ